MAMRILATLGIVAVSFIACITAAATQAGFPERPLWLSHTKPVVGEEISLYTVLYNGTDATIAGTLTFSIDDAKLVSQEVSLAAQSSNVVSVRWTAISGTHSFGAKFETASGTISSIPQQASAVQVTAVEPVAPPAPSALQQNVDKVADVAGNFASSSAPLVQKIVEAVFTKTEAVRNAGIERLEEYIENPRKPNVAGSSTSATRGPATVAASSSESKNEPVLHSVAQAAAASAYFVFRSAYLFYILFAALIFGFLTWGYRRLRRPNR